MRKLVLALMVAIALGCAYPKRFSYTEGTSVTLGLLVPYGEALYGIQALRYLNGRHIESATNLQVEATHSVTGSVFGCES